jgi:hypothetical protein
MFLKISEALYIFGLLFLRLELHIIFNKKILGCNLGYFFRNSSGRPGLQQCDHMFFNLSSKMYKTQILLLYKDFSQNFFLKTEPKFWATYAV